MGKSYVKDLLFTIFVAVIFFFAGYACGKSDANFNNAELSLNPTITAKAAGNSYDMSYAYNAHYLYDYKHDIIFLVYETKRGGAGVTQVFDMNGNVARASNFKERK